ncbi:MAG: VOC family protein [Sedimentitalea sp.]
MKLDHIAITGETLEAARDAVETALGVALQKGGQHDVFGTHNALLGLADGLYLEAIAINPDAPDPGRARWFDLDRFAGAPRLTNWICQTPDLVQTLDQLPFSAGDPVALTRGDLGWKMAVPDSGILPFDNLHPALIQWTAGAHPATRLAPSGCALRRLVISHPEAQQLQQALFDHLSDPRVVLETGEPNLLAEIETPHGLRHLS